MPPNFLFFNQYNMHNVLYSGGKTTTRTPQRVKELFAKRRVIAESMIDSANEVLHDRGAYSPMAFAEARKERVDGIALLATCLS